MSYRCDETVYFEQAQTDRKSAAFSHRSIRNSHESKVYTPYTFRPPYANGRREGKARSTKKSLPSGSNTFQRAAPEFHDRVSGQQHVGTQPWGLPVLGPCQWHRPYRACSRSKRARTSADGGARRVPSPVDGTLHVRGLITGGGRMGAGRGRTAGTDERRPGRREMMPATEVIEGLLRVSSYTRRPATSFLRVLTHINTRYVYTGTTPVFVAVYAPSVLFCGSSLLSLLRHVSSPMPLSPLSLSFSLFLILSRTLFCFSS